jgi:protein-tyrosine phosphatase
MSLDYDEITEAVALGTHPESEEDVDELARRGTTAVLSLQTDEDFARLGLDWRALNRRYAEHDIELQRIPIRDVDRRDLEVGLPEALRALESLLERHGHVYVHCTEGTGRAPAVVVVHLVCSRGWSLEEALDRICTARSSASLERDAIEAVLERIEWDGTWRKGG